MRGIAYSLAEYIAGLTYSEIPEQVSDMAKKCVFDSFANMYCGRYSQMGEKIIAYTKNFPEAVYGEQEISLLGGGRSSRPDVTKIHAVLARCADLDDGNRFAMGHPGSVIIPAAMAAGEVKNRTAEEILTAVVAAYDVYGRIGRAINPSSYREKGFDATGIVGAVSCAAAIGKLYGLSVEELKHALGIAGTFSGGLIEYQNDGTMGKVLCGCFAIETGWKAVQLAKSGFTGPEEIFEGKKGFFQAFSVTPDGSAVLENLGQDFKILETYFKKHACMRGLHAAVDAVLELRNKQGLRAEEVESLLVHTTSFVKRLSKPHPDTLIAAQCSLEFALAAALEEGNISREEVLEEAMKKETVYELASKITLEMDDELKAYVEKNPSHWGAVRLEAHKKNGNVLECFVPLPEGEAEKPLDWEALYEKFAHMTEGTPYEKRTDELYEKFRNFEKQGDITDIYRL